MSATIEVEIDIWEFWYQLDDDDKEALARDFAEMDEPEEVLENLLKMKPSDVEEFCKEYLGITDDD